MDTLEEAEVCASQHLKIETSLWSKQDGLSGILSLPELVCSVCALHGRRILLIAEKVRSATSVGKLATSLAIVLKVAATVVVDMEEEVKDMVGDTGQEAVSGTAISIRSKCFSINIFQIRLSTLNIA